MKKTVKKRFAEPGDRPQPRRQGAGRGQRWRDARGLWLQRHGPLQPLHEGLLDLLPLIGSRSAI